MKHFKTLEKVVKVDDGVAERKHRDSASILILCLLAALAMILWCLLSGRT